MSTYPVDRVEQTFKTALTQSGCILYAPPGSGKTTRVPLWCLSEQISFLLIPTRVAVLMAAQRLADQLGETVGKTVGYRLRHNSRVGQSTKLIVTTYGTFLQTLLNDPEQLVGATVIYDEFHERSVDQDLCFALLQQFKSLFDENLRQVFMSATLNIEPLKTLTALPLIEAPGRSYPVEIQYCDIDTDCPKHLARLIVDQWQTSKDHILVFLPGWRSIDQLSEHLPDAIPTFILHGQLERLPALDTLEDRSPTVILATNIAESSITLNRVHTVIDTGLERYASTHPITGISQLKTRKISQASATQRAGRAGRLAPGLAIRCWSEDDQSSRAAHQPAEMEHANLDPLLLRVTAWGTAVEELQWLNPPSLRRISAARKKLLLWRAIDDKQQLTDHGRTMLNTGLEPWLAHFLSLATQYQCGEAAALLATKISCNTAIDYPPLQQRVLPKLMPAERIELQRLLQRLGISANATFKPLTEALIIEAFSDRLVWLSDTKAQFITGTEVRFSSLDIRRTGILIDAQKMDRYLLARSILPVSQTAILNSPLVKKEVCFRPKQNPNFLMQYRIGAITLKSMPHQASPLERSEAWMRYLEQTGEAALTLNDQHQALKQRWLLAAEKASFTPWPTENWPEVIEPFLMGSKKLSDIDVLEALKNYCGYPSWQWLERTYPSTWVAPSGRVVTLIYEVEKNRISTDIKLQEVFGLAQQPTIADIPITLNLTAPNGRPVAQVNDLPHFWQHVYPEVRKELRGRYAKHPWPENPLEAIATSKTKRQLGNNSFNA